MPNPSPWNWPVGDGPYSIKGKLDYISPQVDASSGTLALRGVFPNTDGKLLPGLFVRVQVPTEREDEVMVIPRQAVLENQGKSFVYVIAQGQPGPHGPRGDRARRGQ